MSLFAVISALATDAGEPLDDDFADDEPDDGSDEVELTLAPPPPLAGEGEGGVVTLTRREHKSLLRDENAARARELVRRTGMTHAQVNAELNRLSGVRKIAEATVEQLPAGSRQRTAGSSRPDAQTRPSASASAPSTARNSS